jgi:hypothetical protein
VFVTYSYYEGTARICLGLGNEFTTSLPRFQEPSLTEAADAMRWVHENPVEARALGARAKACAEQTLSLQAAGERFARRLGEIKMNKTGKVDSPTETGAVSKSHSIKGQR